MPHRGLNILLLLFVTAVLYSTIGMVPGWGWHVAHVFSTACAASTVLAFVLFRQTPPKKETEELLKAKIANCDAMHNLMKANVNKMKASIELVEATKKMLDAQIQQLLVEEKDKMLYDFLRHKFEVGHTKQAQEIIDRLQTNG